ncbi:Piwi-domain-containing protein [Jackrogersella minutella]|nr:Piwi-domain-containing protein [Jackrogersella minutella]
MSDRPPGSRRGSATPPGSQSGSKPGSKAGSPTKGSANPTEFPEGEGIDPARERRPLTATELLGKRFDLPADAYKTGKGETRFTARPGYATQGKPIKVQLNIFPVTNWTDSDIIQYDITVSPNLKESHALVKKVWNTKTVTEALRKQGGRWLYDGSKLAWSSEKITRGETKITVDLDGLKEKAAAEHELVAKKVARNSVYYLSIRQTTTVRLSYLKAYLQGKISWDNHVLECMNFFDHCLRQYPSEQWLTIKRNFYHPAFPITPLAGDIIANQGIYCAPRLSEAINRGGTGLSINVDRCQTAFWPEDTLLGLVCSLVNSQKEEWSSWDENRIEFNLRPKVEKNRYTGVEEFVPSEPFLFLRRMTKLKFTVSHRGKLGEPRIYSIKRFVFEPAYGVPGGNSRTIHFDKTSEDGTKTKISLYDYYFERWGIKLRWARFPIVETPQGQLFPLELCNTVEHQKYNFRLNPAQTNDMIKRAATRPAKRREDITEGVKLLDWPNDPYLKAFGIKINPTMVISDAKLLQNPEVVFANQKINPGVQGRWDLRGKKFLEPNTLSLNSWSFICLGDDGYTCKQADLEQFATGFSMAYRGHGGRVENAAFCATIPWGDSDLSVICEKAWNMTGNKFSRRPQMIFFILPTKNQLTYERIKKNMDCRFNIVSQCLQGSHVRKSNAQYISNVAMKVNSKLGGVTCRVPSPIPSQASSAPFWKRPTLMIGCDVSHAAAGSQQPSMAALTMSMDRNATRFAASVQTNGYRQETILAVSMHDMLPKLIKHWMLVNKTVPEHVYYLRDGVSEGQFQQVLEKEVTEMKRAFREKNAGDPKFTTIIATKRHHVRFFPKAGDKATSDRNGNPLPGTLVERDVTHPQHFDFYLCSHVAIQGTARPVHYQVIADEAGVQPNDLVKMIYQQCYQYCRSTTPVSLHPAVYYAHLASNRGRCHEAVPSEQRVMAYGKPGFPYAKGHSDIYEGGQSTNAPPLMAMDGGKSNADQLRFMNTTMWYV